MKVCTKCEKAKPVEEYWRHPRAPDGLAYWCKDCNRAYKRAWYARNIEGERARHKVLNATRVKDSKKYHKAGRTTPWMRQWRKDNPEKERAAQQRRLARKAQVAYTLTRHEWQDILDNWDHRCAYCGIAGVDLATRLNQEHIVPLSQGGPYSAENIVPACGSCNSQKGARTPEQAGMKLRHIAEKSALQPSYVHDHGITR